MKHTFKLFTSSVIFILLTSILSASAEEAMRLNKKNNIPACGKKSHAYINKEGIYSKTSKFYGLSDEIKEKICKSHDYAKLPEGILSCTHKKCGSTFQ